MKKRRGMAFSPEIIELVLNRIRASFDTQKVFIDACGISESTFQNFRAEKRIDRSTFRRMCEVLDLDAEELIQQAHSLEDRVETVELLHPQNSNLQGEPASFTEKYYSLPGLPPYVLERSHDIHRLRDMIADPLTNKVGMVGMPGIGKSVLAEVLAQESDVQRAFPDGIFWILCGQEGALTSRQRQLARALGGTPQPFVNNQDGRTFLSKQIGCKQCLVILDDVWQLEQIHAFDALGENCKLLITTQNKELLTASGSEKHELKPLNQEEALALLTRWSGQDAEKLKAAREVAQECEGLPLALVLCGALIREDSSSWEDLRDALRAAEIRFLDHEIGSVTKVLQISFEALSRKNAEHGRLYQMLAVFAKSTPIPEAAILTLWLHTSKLNEREARRLIKRLANRALLTISENSEKRTVHLHGLQQGYLCNISYDLKSLNDKLLEAYQTKCPAGWASGPNDGYYLEHLVKHLFKSGRDNEVYELLIGSPNWMQRKFEDCQGDAAYVSDLDLARSRFDDPLVCTQLCAARHAINCRVSRYSDTHLKLLVLLNRQTEALTQARLSPNAEGRFYSLVSVYESLKEKGQPTDTLVDELLETVKEIKFEPVRNYFQLRLQKILNPEEPLSTPEKAVTTPFQEISDSSSRGPIEESSNKNWIDRLKSFSEKEREELKESSNFYRLIGNLTKKGCYEDVESLIDQVIDPAPQALLVEDYVSRLIQVQQFSRAEAMIEKILVPERKASTLIDLAFALARNNQVEKADNLFEQAQSVVECHQKELKETLEKDFRAEIRKSLLVVVKGLANIGCIKEAEAIANQITSSYWQARMLISIVSVQIHLNRLAGAGKLLNQVEELSTQISPDELRSPILEVAFTQAVELGFQEKANSLLTDVLHCMKGIENEFLRAREQARFVRTLVQSQRIREARELLQSIEDSYWYPIGLAFFAEAQAQQTDALAINALFDQAFASVQEIEDECLRSRAEWEIEGIQRRAVKNREVDSELPRFVEETEKLAQSFCKDFEEALSSQTSEDLFTVLAQWMPSFEQVEQGLSLKVVREVTRIAGWMTPEWAEISELF